MTELLIDACGWVACIDGGINLDHELSSLMGPTDWVLTTGVLEELNRLNKDRPARKGLLLPLLLARAELLPAAAAHTDDDLFGIATARGCATLTVDIGLKHRLFEANLPVVEVKQGSFLNLVDAL